MSRYSVQDLLHLRESPLVKRPDGLPPTEQWMGPPAEQAPRRPGQQRGKIDDGNAHEYEKRPSLLDTHVTRRSSTVTENIVLGPPKTAFASATSTRNSGRAAPADPNDTTTVESPRLQKSSVNDLEGDERGGERRGGRFAGINGRRLEKEDWGTRPRRGFEGDELERRPRRTGEREGQRWEKVREKGEWGEETRRESREEGKYSQKPGRGRFDQPWFRGENGGENPDNDSKGQQRQRGWTRDRRSGAHENDWSMRNEQDPEWMDAPEAEEPKQAHTAEEFQKWKERMKAENEKTPSAETQEAFEGLSLEEKEPVKHAQIKIKPDSDKFFELFAEQKSAEDVPAMTETKKHKTRFAALFSPPPESEIPRSAVEPGPPSSLPQPDGSGEAPGRPASTEADQAGFQRILQMLGGKTKTGASPMDALLNPRSQAGQLDQTGSNPLAGLFMSQDLPKNEPTESKPQSRSSGGLESLLGQQSPKPTDPKRDSAPNKDSEFLLRLMQQSKMSPGPQQPQQPTSQSSHIPGILQMPEALNRSRQPVKSPGGLPSFFDEQPMPNTQRPPPSQGDNYDMQQRLGPRLQMPNDYPLRSNYPKSPQDQPPHHPSAMQRPPGLESAQAPAGWAPHQHQQFPPPPHQLPPQQNPMHAPPGIPNPNISRGMPFPSGPPMPHHNMPMLPPDQRQQQQQPRKLLGNNGPFPPAPPGMQPPPGFMGNPGGPPPPGFPPMPMGNDGMLGPESLPPHQQGMPPRHLMEFFAMNGGGGGNGRPGGIGGMPGPYR